MTLQLQELTDEQLRGLGRCRCTAHTCSIYTGVVIHIWVIRWPFRWHNSCRTQLLALPDLLYVVDVAYCFFRTVWRA